MLVGDKNQCTFCGLNGGSIAFRSESPERVIEELRFLSLTHGVRHACATDNIVGFWYFRNAPSASGPGPPRPGAGIRGEDEPEPLSGRAPEGCRCVSAAQLGIESLATPVLRLMSKGVSAVQNIQTLKWLTASGMEIKWNFLYGFLGEDSGCYGGIPDLIESLIHLAPPQTDGPVRIDRFSPYEQGPADFGLCPPEPILAYCPCFPSRARFSVESHITSPARHSRGLVLLRTCNQRWLPSSRGETLREP